MYRHSYKLYSLEMKTTSIWFLGSSLLCLAGFIRANDLLALRSFCGYQHSDDYNRDSPDVTIDEFPWIAQLLYGKDRHVQCTGSLINNRYVLTAAQCLAYTSPVAVRLGDFNATSDKDCVYHTNFGEECSDPIQEFDIEEAVPHADFDKDTSKNDIGLIRLSRNVEYSDYIRPICLPTPNSRVIRGGEELALSGWGLLSDGGNLTEVKKKILATAVCLRQCNRFYRTFDKVLDRNNICAIETVSYSCHGDGGGPLMMSVRSQWEVVGLLLFGVRCDATTPSVYLNVKNYVGWIKAHVRK
ncbi:phenoloxidase-activating factor 3-like [Photinus pyralis]|uniref:phenoloxidase-activating factor 3-like n=1 Tax=Photinus pyralis TaxID=7054 RepID=UPI0012671198|nr:phenoloxidase-activating factor 3-like [Photinus pyralis]